MSQSPQRIQQLKYLRERVSQLTNKTVTSLANLGYHQFFSKNVFSNQPIEVLQQTLESLFTILPPANSLPHLRRLQNQQQCQEKQQSSQNQRQVDICKGQNINSQKVVKMTNQEYVIQGIAKFVEISEALSQLSQKIYERKHPLDLYKKFRNLYQKINNASNILHQFQFQTQLFVIKKDELINQQIQFLQSVMISTHQSIERHDQQQHSYYPNTLDYPEETQKSFTLSQFNAASTHQVQQLKKQVNYLNQMICRNDQQFCYQIQKYNATLFDLRSQIQGYQFQLQKMNYLEGSLHEIKVSMQRMKEDKYRDELIIENMAKKLRGYQKSRQNGIFMPSKESSRLRLNTINQANSISMMDIRTDIDNFKGQLKDWKSQEKERISNLVLAGLKNSQSQSKLGFYKKKQVQRNMNTGVTFSSKMYQ